MNLAATGGFPACPLEKSGYPVGPARVEGGNATASSAREAERVVRGRAVDAIVSPAVDDVADHLAGGGDLGCPTVEVRGVGECQRPALFDVAVEEQSDLFQ